MRPNSQSNLKMNKAKVQLSDALITVRITDVGEVKVQEEGFKTGNSSKTRNIKEVNHDLEVFNNTLNKERCVNQCTRWAHPNRSQTIIKVEVALDRHIMTGLTNNMHQGPTNEEILQTASPTPATSSHSTQCLNNKKPFTDTHKLNTLCSHRSTFSMTKVILTKTNCKSLNPILDRITDMM